MPRIVGIVGWLLAVGAAAGAGLLYVELESARTELAISREATDIVAVENRQLTRDNEDLKQQIAMVRQKNATLRNDSDTEAPDATGIDTASLIGSLMQNMGAGKSEEDAAATAPDLSSNPFLSKMMESSPEMADIMGAGMKLMQSEAGKEFMSSTDRKSVV